LLNIFSKCTFIHSTEFDAFNDVEGVDFTLMVGSCKVAVKKRPGVESFLAVMAKYFEIVAYTYTADVEEYTDPLLDILDPNGHIQTRLSRDDCTRNQNGNYLKDLGLFKNYPLSQKILVNNNPKSFHLQAIPRVSLPMILHLNEILMTRGSQISSFRPQGFSDGG
jgi:TFIIF-interacting CTD phosphatase-like protein